jgi:hypothetical protein
MDDNFKKMSEGPNLFAEGCKGLINKLVDAFTTAFNQVWPTLKSVFNFMDKTMTKKKFKGMLQAAGIQRNEINKIVANNKDPYTYRRLNEALNLYKKESE